MSNVKPLNESVVVEKVISDADVVEKPEPSAVNVPEPPPVTQFPFIAKHPDVRFIPFAKVDDAIVDVTESRFVEIPPTKVEVAVEVETNEFATTVPPTESFSYGDEVPIPTFPVIESKTKSDDPLNVPPSLNCICVFAPPGFPAPPVPTQVPLIERHPLVIAMPPANVEVEVFETVRFVSVVVPALKEPAFIVALFIVPPLIVGLFITVFVSWSILWL